MPNRGEIGSGAHVDRPRRDPALYAFAAEARDICYSILIHVLLLAHTLLYRAVIVKETHTPLAHLTLPGLMVMLLLWEPTHAK